MGQTIINIEQLRKQSEGYPCLPSNWERENLVRLIDEVAPLIGLKAKAVATFRAMIARTKPSAFKDPNDEPICYVHQTEIAHSLRVTAKTVRNHEHALEKLGLIERRTMANGARTGFQGCGIYFSAAIQAIPELMARAQAAEADRREHAKLRGLRSTHYKHTKGVLNELMTQYGQNAELGNLLHKFDQWPHSSALHRMPLDELYDHVEEAAALYSEVIELQLKYKEYAARPEKNGASYIQDSNQDSSNKSCNASDSIMTEDKSSDPNSIGATPHGSAPCLEKKYEDETKDYKNEFMNKISPQRFLSFCSPEMQELVHLAQRGRSTLADHDFEEAAYERLYQIGISKSIWDEACKSMGSPAATTCVIITDANMNRPNNPVRSPGAYMRTLIKQHKDGKLNIIASLIALSERTRH